MRKCESLDVKLGRRKGPVKHDKGATKVCTLARTPLAQIELLNDNLVHLKIQSTPRVLKYRHSCRALVVDTYGA